MHWFDKPDCEPKFQCRVPTYGRLGIRSLKGALLDQPRRHFLEELWGWRYELEAHEW